jgi:YD repeat-containing protein
MTTKTFDLWQAYQAGPAMWGAVQDTTPLQYIHKGVPFLVTNESAPGNGYIYDNLGRLVEVSMLPQGSAVYYNYDPMGNRESVVTTAGLGGL